MGIPDGAAETANVTGGGNHMKIKLMTVYVDDQGQRAAMFYTDDVQRGYGRMQAAGAEFTMPPTKVTGSTIAMVNDTCGNLIQIAQLDRYSG
jgi:predicted enzyme related to lactoylglutathione lyase